ncbi:hypothetical protein ACIHFE_30955 [Streptomyces sp. NPDC052396]|uniref:hypothetical protein n=1 Tax=Streptomyces sp. NPDC052396 TaxID=3365689 RepID=UPI0037D2208A
MNNAAETPQTGWRGAWRAAHASVTGVPRWARAVAHVIPFLVMPSGIWRIATVVFDVAGDGRQHSAADPTAGLPDPVYVTFLSVFSELLAFTAIGLVAAWGEVFPRWIPVLRGRRVPIPAAVIPAAAGATALTVLWTTLAVQIGSGVTLQGNPLPDDFPTIALHGWRLGFFLAAYAPVLLWGPLLALLTVAYWRRRRIPVLRTPVPDATA